MIDVGSRVYWHGRHFTVEDRREGRNWSGETSTRVLLVPDGAKKRNSIVHWIDEWRVERYAFSIKKPEVPA